MLNYEERKLHFLNQLKNAGYNLHEDKNKIIELINENLENLTDEKDKELENFYKKLLDEVIKIF